MQVIAQIFFKMGSQNEDRWLFGFIVGNLFGFSSIWLLMQVYKAIHPNIALGLATAGSFILSQLALVIVFKAELVPIQWGGMLVIVLGVVMLSSGQNL